MFLLKIGTHVPTIKLSFALSKRKQMHTNEKATTPNENIVDAPPTETPINENGEVPVVNTGEEIAHTGEPIAAESLPTPPPAENTTTVANNGNTDANEDEPVVKKGNRVAYTCNLSVDEDAHVQPQIDDLIKFGVVETKADFIRKAIDVYLNYNNVCTENKLEQPFVLPVPDGENGSIKVQPKLLKNSLFKKHSQFPTF